MNVEVVRRVFDRIAPVYDRHAALQQEVARRLAERIPFQRREPRRILDLGCGTGYSTGQLRRAFRKAQIVALDAVPGMLARAGGRQVFRRAPPRVCADMVALPLAARCTDLVFSNLAVLWQPDLPVLFAEVRRVLRPDGMLLFSSIGPASLPQLAGPCSSAGRQVPLHGLPDVMALGDSLVAAGFSQPVMDTDRITLQYPSADAALHELEATGLALLLDDGGELGEVRTLLREDAGGNFPIAFEVIYGTAFGPADGQPRRTPEGEVATFPADSLPVSRSMGYDWSGQKIVSVW